MLVCSLEQHNVSLASSPSSLLHAWRDLRVVWRGVLCEQSDWPEEDDAAVSARGAAPRGCGGQRGPLLAVCRVAVPRPAGGGDHP